MYQTKTEAQALGTFTLAGTVLRVTDPCYDREVGSRCLHILENVLPGEWRAGIIISKEGVWGNRVAELIVSHTSAKNPNYIWVSNNICVDSGQAGFFDDSLFPQGETGEYDDKNSFYGKCCSLTHDEENRDQKGGVIEFGAVSSTGFGDGSYELRVAKDNEGRVIAAKIIFIDDNGDEDDDEE